MKREFRLEICGTIDDPDGDLPTSELWANLEGIVQNAMSNGLITQDSSATLETYDRDIDITNVESE